MAGGRKFFRGMIVAVVMAAVPVFANAADDITADVADPMFIEALGDSTFRTSVDFGKYFQAREIVSYGFSNKFSVAADLRYRDGTKNDTDGFSDIGILATFRASNNEAVGATDLLFAYGFGGMGLVPNFADDVWTVGVRTGRQWGGMTLAATILTNWIFDEQTGIGYIDFVPEAYFRLKGDWSFGISSTLRKSTTGVFDQEWLNAKVGTTIGHTGWFMNIGHEFENKEFRIGGTMTMLF